MIKIRYFAVLYFVIFVCMVFAVLVFASSSWASQDETPQKKIERLEKEIHELEVYKTHVEKLIVSQAQDKSVLESQAVAGGRVQQGLAALMYRMLEQYEMIINQGPPVEKQQRLNRLDELTQRMRRADIAEAEKLRQILEAYQIEIDYGMKMGRYSGQIQISETELRQVEFLYVGYLTLMARSQDKTQLWLWQESDQKWHLLKDIDAQAIETAYLLADKQQAPSLLVLPMSLSKRYHLPENGLSATKQPTTQTSSTASEALQGQNNVETLNLAEGSLDKTQELEQKVKDLLTLKAQLQQQNKALMETFESNEAELISMQASNQNKVAQLVDISAFARASAKEVQQAYQTSHMLTRQQTHSDDWLTLLKDDNLANLSQLESLWQAMQTKIQFSRQLTELEIDLIQGDGSQIQTTAIQLGDIGLVTSMGYVAWDYEKQLANLYSSLPENGPNLEQLKQGDHPSIVIDPMRGEQLANFSEQPTLWQRIDLAGGVGKVIIALLVVGLLISMVRGFHLLRIKRQISKQLKAPERIFDNPLGRVLSVFEQGKEQLIETIELRLLERILDEQEGLERGLSMLKLLASLAPMLGLLGTVTGMIETFQVITQFGNGDPKIMAGGISMALMTTVLGLVAAMPLLLAHNLLSTMAEDIHAVLEKQGVSLVARRAEEAQSV